MSSVIHHDRSPEPSWDIQQLLTPTAFGHAVTEIELIETHISWVILTGNLAYKIKKPIKLEFLDFSTVEKRYENCLREVQINLFFAPDLYLGVVPITRHQSECRMDGSGPAIDWAIKMKQFPQSALLINMLRPGHPADLPQSDPMPERMDQLAQHIADYHRRAEIAPADSPHADLKNVFDPAIANFSYLNENLAPGPTRRDLARLQQWTVRQIQDQQQEFLRRTSLGFIRACHGDLHLGNVLMLDDRFYAFDAIEFNDALRWIDTFNDVAFLLMELHDHERHDLSNRLLNQYLESSSDYGGLRVLPFYLVYRAMVRAKIDLIRARQVRRQSLSGEGVQYVRHALEFASAPRPRLWITHGFSGSGKSTRALWQVQTQGFIRLRSDVVRKKRFGLQPLDKAAPQQIDQMYSAENTVATYQALLDLASEIIEAGFSVIVDATFLMSDSRREFADLAKRLGVEFGILDCNDTDPADLSRRIANRGADPSDADESVLRWQLAHHDPLDCTEKAWVVKLQGDEA